MKSVKAGNDTSHAEVLNVSPHGFWLLIANQAVTMQLNRSRLLELFAQNFVVQRLQIFYRICARFTPRFAQKSALQPLPSQLHGYGQEYFLGFDIFPWFRKASVEQLFKVEFLHGDHLYWPELDIDLNIERIEKPEKFPLVARVVD